jgi:hypothetical protein
MMPQQGEQRLPLCQGGSAQRIGCRLECPRRCTPHRIVAQQIAESQKSFGCQSVAVGRCLIEKFFSADNQIFLIPSGEKESTLLGIFESALQLLG